jgi:hypothetical protein
VELGVQGKQVEDTPLEDMPLLDMDRNKCQPLPLKKRLWETKQCKDWALVNLKILEWEVDNRKECPRLEFKTLPWQHNKRKPCKVERQWVTQLTVCQ